MATTCVSSLKSCGSAADPINRPTPSRLPNATPNCKSLTRYPRACFLSSYTQMSDISHHVYPKVLLLGNRQIPKGLLLRSVSIWVLAVLAQLLIKESGIDFMPTISLRTACKTTTCRAETVLIAAGCLAFNEYASKNKPMFTRLAEQNCNDSCCLVMLDCTYYLDNKVAYCREI